MIFSDANSSQTSSNEEQPKTNSRKKTYHPLLRPLVTFWEFSSYYADYKARIWDMK